MPMPELFDTEPSLTPLYKRHWWVLNKSWTYKDITIPAGFASDLDSVPHIPFIYFLYKGRSRTTALAHDYEYAIGQRSRKEIDQRFLRNMLEDNLPKWVALTMYWAVRIGGSRYYKRSRGVSIAHRLESRMIDSLGRVPCLDY